MNHPIQNFTTPTGSTIRTLTQNGNPWFIAVDVCKTLDITNGRDAVSRLDEDEKGVGTADTLGGSQNCLIVSESGLYSLILTSRKPEAKAFKRWITHEILPAIRKTGGYSIPQNLPDALLLAANLARKNSEQAAKIEKDAPKVEAYHDFLDADGLFTFNDAAHLMQVEGVGSRKLFSLCRDMGLIQKDGTKGYQSKTPRFKGISNPWTDGKGVSHAYTQLMVYPETLPWLKKRITKYLADIAAMVDPSEWKDINRPHGAIESDNYDQNPKLVVNVNTRTPAIGGEYDF